jgi:hypothetical protein
MIAAGSNTFRLTGPLPWEPKANLADPPSTMPRIGAQVFSNVRVACSWILAAYQTNHANP